MRLFEEYEKETTKELCYKDGTVAFPSKTVHKMRMKEDTIEYILNAPNDGIMSRVRYLIANLYNHNTYPNVDIFGALRNADIEHEELIMDIIGISQSKYGDSCFRMIEELAPRVIDKFIE